MMSLATAPANRLGALQAGAAALEAAGVETARSDAEWLLASVLEVERFGLYLDSARALAPGEAERYRSLVVRRAAREPLQHLLGFEAFDGMKLAVTPDVLVPRPETEGLAEWAAEVLGTCPDAVIADVGTGSGAIACALARRLPGLRVLAVDCSAGAAAVAAANVSWLDLGDRVTVVIGDLLESVGGAPGMLDMVVANPPYISSGDVDALPPEVSRFEPRLALDGGPDGMAVARRIIAAAGPALRPGGWLMMEIGPEQAGALGSAMAAEGFDEITVRCDLAGRRRYLAGRWQVGVPGPGRSV